MLEHHAHAPPEHGDVHRRSQDVLAEELNLPRDFHSADQIVHAIKAAQECGLSAAAGANKSGHPMPGHGKADLPEGGLAFVADGELLNLQAGVRGVES